jgi:hypothetical protein
MVWPTLENTTYEQGACPSQGTTQSHTHTHTHAHTHAHTHTHL